MWSLFTGQKLLTGSVILMIFLLIRQFGLS